MQLAIIFAFVDIGGFFSFTYTNLTGGYLVINIISSVMMAISTVATIFSGWNYVWGGRNLFKEDNKSK